ncbi:conserved hypothetical protein [Neospora caninum Liverpool]|uniref:Uncharacterized protein n=1 Tax=Neospora caninum (strain Liverpool) TaxID=572307 RepID=F0VBS0_NEOCL|nr:conserved hypothetical protein [Neospora caninum Liverpool]CBZ51054.1 conserved hypothetical protein [Neospora caninum Liverpool]CEL68360.1 TPA: hypothetical protein BN1204_041290 [Neospora caninum Liverpool]|eukprot:XP_003881087.1 conserved hypothetical protein [Neospora caninum Liverpool]
MASSAFEQKRQASCEGLLKRLVAAHLHTYLGVSVPAPGERQERKTEGEDQEAKPRAGDDEDAANEEIVRRNAEVAFEFAKTKCTFHSFGTINPASVKDEFSQLLLSLEAQHQVGKAAALRRCLAAFLTPPYEPLVRHQGAHLHADQRPTPAQKAGAKRDAQAQEKEEEEKRCGILRMLLSLAQHPVSDAQEVLVFELERDRERRETRRTLLEEARREDERAAEEELEALRREHLEAYLEAFFDSSESSDGDESVDRKAEGPRSSPWSPQRRRCEGSAAELSPETESRLAVPSSPKEHAPRALEEATAETEVNPEARLPEASPELERIAERFLHGLVSLPAPASRQAQGVSGEDEAIEQSVEKDRVASRLLSTETPLAAVLPPRPAAPPAGRGAVASRSAPPAPLLFTPRSREPPFGDARDAGCATEAWLVQHVLLALSGLDAAPVFLRCNQNGGIAASRAHPSGSSSPSFSPLGVVQPNPRLPAVEHLSPAAVTSALGLFSFPASAVLLLSRFSTALGRLAFAPLHFARREGASLSLHHFLEAGEDAQPSLQGARAARPSACLDATKHAIDALFLHWTALLSELQQAQTASLHAEAAFPFGDLSAVGAPGALAAFRRFGPLPPLGRNGACAAEADVPGERRFVSQRPLTLLSLFLEVREHLRCWTSLAGAVEKALQALSFPPSAARNSAAPFSDSQPRGIAPCTAWPFGAAEGAAFGLAFLSEGLGLLQDAEMARDGVLERFWNFFLFFALHPLLLALDRCMRFGEVRGFPTDIRLLLQRANGEAFAAQSSPGGRPDERGGGAEPDEDGEGRPRIPVFLLDLVTASQRTGQAVAAVREVERTRGGLSSELYGKMEKKRNSRDVRTQATPQAHSPDRGDLSDGGSTRGSSRDDTPEEDIDVSEGEGEDSEDDDAQLWEKLERENPSLVAASFLKKIRNAGRGAVEEARHPRAPRSSCLVQDCQDASPTGEQARRRRDETGEAVVACASVGNETVDGKLEMLVRRLRAWEVFPSTSASATEEAFRSPHSLASPTAWNEAVSAMGKPHSPALLRDTEALFHALRPSSLSAVPPTVAASVCLLDVLCGTSLGQRRQATQLIDARLAIKRMDRVPPAVSGSLPLCTKGPVEGVARGGEKEDGEDATVDAEVLRPEGVTSLFLQARVRPALLALAREEEENAVLVSLHWTHILEAVAVTRAIALLQVKSEMRPLFRLLFSPAEAPLAHVDPVQLNCVLRDLLLSPAAPKASATPASSREAPGPESRRLGLGGARAERKSGDCAACSSVCSILHRSLSRALGAFLRETRARRDRQEENARCPDSPGSEETRPHEARGKRERRDARTEAIWNRIFSLDRMDTAGRALALSLTTENPLLSTPASGSLHSRRGERSERGGADTRSPRVRRPDAEGTEINEAGDRHTPRLAFAYLTLQYAGTPFPVSVHPRYAAQHLLSADVTCMYSAIFAFLLELERSAGVLCRLPAPLCWLAASTARRGTGDNRRDESDRRTCAQRCEDDLAGDETPPVDAPTVDGFLQAFSTRFYQTAVKLRGELCHVLFSLQRHVAFVCGQHSSPSLLRRLLACRSLDEMTHAHLLDLRLLLALLLVPVHGPALSSPMPSSSPSASADLPGSTVSFQLNEAVAPHVLLLLRAPCDLQRLVREAQAAVNGGGDAGPEAHRDEETPDDALRWRKNRGRLPACGARASAPRHAAEPSQHHSIKQTEAVSPLLPETERSERQTSELKAQLDACMQSLEALHFNVRRAALCLLALLRTAVFSSPTMILESCPLTDIVDRDVFSVSAVLFGKIAAECMSSSEPARSSQEASVRPVQNPPFEGGTEVGVCQEVACGLRLLYSMLDFSNFYSATLDALACEEYETRGGFLGQF